MVTDFEQVLLDLKAHVLSKRSHGQDELLGKIAEFEVKNRLPEGFDDRPVPLRRGDTTAHPSPSGKTLSGMSEPSRGTPVRATG